VHRAGDFFDVTHPAPKLLHGHIHPLTKAQEDIMSIFAMMGFRVLEGPEVETEFNNFDALNIPADHPARDMQDTFWVRGTSLEGERMLLRTHTSPMQVRFMQTHEPPFRILVPGRVFRNEATDMRHEWQFHQVEGLMVDRQSSMHPISMAHLKGVMEYFFRRFFGEDVDVKFVASYFAFTEPSVEVYIKGKKGKLAGRWMEVAGAGMVHQNVFKAAGYVPGEYQGFAFGVCVERLAMLKYKVDDIRLFHGGDIRFLGQMH
jgi:phenylalanyl-tRNA synthetase alpha chain